jgi:hypothetical protein
MGVRVIAIDWSGAKKNPRRKIWRSEFIDGKPLLPKDGLDRSETVTYLKSATQGQDRVFVGLDFAFSFPSWFVRKQGCSDVAEIWNRVEEQGERWLDECRNPFWGRRRQKCELATEFLFRQTERDSEPILGIRAKSVFQLAGGGHVGTGSLRGMTFLAGLRQCYAIWPFDPPSRHVVVEIYPRRLTGAIKKSNKQERTDYLCQPEFQKLPTEWLRVASSCEDAFDAAISAYKMNQHIDTLTSLQRTCDPEVLLEGMIWDPQCKN